MCEADERSTSPPDLKAIERGKWRHWRALAQALDSDLGDRKPSGLRHAGPGAHGGAARSRPTKCRISRATNTCPRVRPVTSATMPRSRSLWRFDEAEAGVTPSSSVIRPMVLDGRRKS